MKRYFLAAILAFLVHLTPLGQASEEIPPRASYVNDFAALFSDEMTQKLEIVLEDFERKTTNQVLVATFDTLGDEQMEEYAARLADVWKIGYKDLANGVILMIFRKEQRAWIETGHGLREKIPLTFCRELIQNQIGPNFRNRSYDTGAWITMRKIIRKIDPSYEFPRFQTKKYPMAQIVLSLFSIVLIITLAIDFVSYWVYRAEILKSHERVYWHHIGTYSFFEWWLIYGFLAHAVEYLYFYLFLSWFNSSFLITGQGTRGAFIRFATGRGRFWGNGNSGKW